MGDIKEIYGELYRLYGHDEKALGWTKNKQHIRFSQLMRFLMYVSPPPKKNSLLDVGCGFGDLYAWLKEHNYNDTIEYYGIDIMESFIEEAKQNHYEIKDRFAVKDFLKTNEEDLYDFIVASGIFGYNDGGYEYVERVFRRAYQACKTGFAMDFLSDKVDYRASETNFFANPEKVLGIAYKYSRNVILDNTAMPFEYTVTVLKNDSFKKETTIFDIYRENMYKEE
jgi:SAM-dependent methyltransferase